MPVATMGHWSGLIFKKGTGAIVGLLLMAYGAASLWRGRAASVVRATGDSPTSLHPVATLALHQAQANLVAAPASAYRWADLAEAEVDANHVDRAEFGMRQALAAAPGNPAILFRAARLYLRLEDYSETLRQLTAVLRNPDLSDYYDHVFTLYSEMDLPLSELLNQGLPRTPQAASAFLRFWIQQGKLEEADETWKWIAANSLTSLQSTGSYVELLARNEQWEKAEQSWSDYTARLDPEYRKSNFLYNGSFEMSPADSPFDWRLRPVGNVAVTRDPENGDRGSTSLQFTFSGTPAEAVAPASQIVLLSPGAWELKARMKTRKLTSDQGVVIRVVDAKYPERLSAATDSLEGTEDWTTISAQFEVKPDTRLVRVEVVRPPSREFDSQLHGTAWVDSIELRPLQRVTSVKPARLSEAGQPCENNSNCRGGQAPVQSASQ